MSITISQKGSFSKTLNWLKKTRKMDLRAKLVKYGQMGVDALREATPKDTGLTSESWNYEIHVGKDEMSIVWTNSNNNHGVYIAVLIQYGHATRGGGYVQGRDYINPTMQPIFDKMVDDIMEEVNSNGGH